MSSIMCCLHLVRRPCCPTNEIFQLELANENAPKNTVFTLVAPNPLWVNGNDWMKDQQPAGIVIQKYGNAINTPLIRRLRKHETSTKKQSWNKRGKQRTQYLAQTSHVFILKDELTNELVKGKHVKTN